MTDKSIVHIHTAFHEAMPPTCSRNISHHLSCETSCYFMRFRGSCVGVFVVITVAFGSDLNNCATELICEPSSSTFDNSCQYLIQSPLSEISDYSHQRNAVY